MSIHSTIIAIIQLALFCTFYKPYDNTTKLKPIAVYQNEVIIFIIKCFHYTIYLYHYGNNSRNTTGRL